MQILLHSFALIIGQVHTNNLCQSIREALRHVTNKIDDLYASEFARLREVSHTVLMTCTQQSATVHSCHE